MIAATATFIVLKFQRTPLNWRIMTAPTDLTEIAHDDAKARPVSTRPTIGQFMSPRSTGCCNS